MKKKSKVDLLLDEVLEKEKLIADSKKLYEEVFGVNVELPQKPPDKDIVNYGLKPKDQKFTYTIHPDYGKLSNEEQRQFLRQEIKKIKNGEWYFINGKLRYIPGAYYFILNYVILDDGRPRYRDSQRRYMVFCWMAEKDPHCFGTILIKGRRWGATAVRLGSMLCRGTRNTRKYLGILSKSGADAKKTFAKLSRMFDRLPSYIKPAIDGKARDGGKLHFISPTRRTTVNNPEIETAGGLDTRIDWQNTTDNAYDGEKMFEIFGDEGGKWLKVKINEWVEIAVRTLVDNLNSTHASGKIHLTSTINKDSAGGEGYKKVYKASDYFVRNENGNTESGLYKIFVPAFDGWPGFVDEFGDSVIEDPKVPTYDEQGNEIKIGAKTYFLNIRKGIKDPEKLQEHIRLHPFTEAEALRSYEKFCPFHAQNISDQLSWIETEDKKVIYGNFRWKDGIRDSRVIWEPVLHAHEGRWAMIALPNEAQQELAYLHFKNRRPIPNGPNVAGVDPYDTDKTIDKRASKGSSHIGLVPSEINPLDAPVFMTEYCFRSPTAALFYEDMIMQCVFFGCQMFIESTRGGGMKTYLRERGYGEYIYHIDEGYFTGKFNSRILDGVGASRASSALLNSIEDVTYKSVNKVYFPRTLQDWLDFAPTDTEKYDLTMSSGYTLIAMDKSRFLLDRAKQNSEPIEIFRTFKPRYR